MSEVSAIKEVNKYIKKAEYEMFSLNIIKEDASYKAFGKVFSKLYEYIDKVSAATAIEDVEYIMNNIGELSPIIAEAITDFENQVDTYFYSRKTEILRLANSKLKYTKPCNQKEALLIKRNIELFLRRGANMVRKDINIAHKEALQLVDDLDKLVTAKRIELSNIELNDLSEVDKKKLELGKIFDYKDMIRLAEENGFIYDRTSGDHMIYKNEDTYRIVVIPAHTLGYGLMCKIQRQIQERSKAI